MNLDLHLTTACNMKCSFCGAWEYGKEPFYIPFEEAARALEAGRRLGYRITTLTGGEPSIHPEYERIIQYARDLGYWTVVTTNGLRLTEQMAETYRKCRTLVRVSLHTLKPELHQEITGEDTLSRIQDNIQEMSRRGIRLGLGCTVFDENIEEVKSMARFAYKQGASFIRYTPVVGIRGAGEMRLEYDFFRRLVGEISRICADNMDLLEWKDYPIQYSRQIVDYMLTRRCAGGSGQHIIFDCRGSVIACSFIPEEAHLSAGKEISQIEDRFREVYRKVDGLFDRNLAENLKGECGTCSSKKSCMGGCLTMKIPLGLGFGDEQPVCMRRLIDDVCSSFNEQQQRDLFSYWCSGYLLKTGSRNTERVCIRRLPIWEGNFRYGVSRERNLK